MYTTCDKVTELLMRVTYTTFKLRHTRHLRLRRHDNLLY